MGQAKLRGNFEQRKAQAEERERQALEKRRIEMAQSRKMQIDNTTQISKRTSTAVMSGRTRMGPRAIAAIALASMLALDKR